MAEEEVKYEYAVTNSHGQAVTQKGQPSIIETEIVYDQEDWAIKAAWELNKPLIMAKVPEEFHYRVSTREVKIVRGEWDGPKD